MMDICEFCKEIKDVELVDNKYICEDCFEIICLNGASIAAVKDWQQAVLYRNGYDDVIDSRIEKILVNICCESTDLHEQKERILNELEFEIKIRLKYYHKDELFVALLTVKELIRRRLLTDNRKIEWVILNDISAINLLMKIANEIEDFENRPMGYLENNCSNFANAICYARRYNTIVENFSISFGKNITIKDICHEAIQTEDTEKYFEKYLKNAFNEKPEDYIIKDEVLKTKMENEGKTPDLILNSLEDLIKKEFGFSRKDYQQLSTLLLKMEFPNEDDYWNFIKGKNKIYEHFPLFVMKKALLEQICGMGELQSILKTFSINRNIDTHKNIYELELFCFYEVNDLLILGNFDFAQTVSNFEKFLLSGDFVDIYKNNISKNKEITKAQKNLSKYFSACVSDYLYANGYKLPMETYLNKKIPRSEIKKIEINGNNILISNEKPAKELGDIDVLAINTLKKEILLFELKYFKPAISSKDMLLKDKSKIVDKEVRRHIQEREKVIVSNVDEVVKYILGEYQYGYTVKSILLTARTNFYGIQEKEMEYITWSDLFKQVKK
jgi:hypothetical protein